MYIPELVITLRAEEPQSFGKFGAVAESDGQDILWISSGWANEEQGVVWSYNISAGLSKIRGRESYLLDKHIQHFFNNPQENYEIAKVFAQGSEPKVRTYL
jgi:hypothetical protein